MSASRTLYAFVYGTLKSTWWNHDAWMRGFTRMEPATMHGRLLVRQTGTPILELPPGHRLLEGSADLRADLAAHHALLEGPSHAVPPPQTDGAPWLEVRGELYAFHEGEAPLRGLDELEDFHPGGDSLYERVLAPVRGASVPHAWVYTVPRDKTSADYTEALDPTNWDARVELGRRHWTHPKWDGR